MKKLGGKCFRIVLIISVVIIGLGFVEVVLRLYARLKPIPASRIRVESFFHPLHPYWGHDDRSPYMPAVIQKDDPREYSILILGGSTALDIPEPLEEFLNAKNPSREISRYVVHNGAHHGFHSAQDRNVLVDYLGHGSEIDMVVCIEGFNNLIRPLENHAYGLPPRFPGWYWVVGNQMEYGNPAKYYLAKFLSELSDIPLIRRIMVFRWSLSGAVNILMRSYHLQGMEAVAEKVNSIPHSEKVEILRAGAEFYKQDILFMHSLCSDRSIQSIFVLHPLMGLEREEMTPYEKDFLARSPMYDLQLAPLPVWAEGYRALREAGIELRDSGVDYQDYTGLFNSLEGNPYRDLMHLNELGWNTLAERLADYIIGISDVSYQK